MLSYHLFYLGDMMQSQWIEVIYLWSVEYLLFGDCYSRFFIQIWLHWVVVWLLVLHLGGIHTSYKGESSCCCLVILDNMVGTNAILIETYIEEDGKKFNLSIITPESKNVNIGTDTHLLSKWINQAIIA